MAELSIMVQRVSGMQSLPRNGQFRKWAKAAISVDTEVTLRIVDEEEGRNLNRVFRGKDYATNVLTFVLAEKPHLMGDIVICAPVVANEASAQGKSLEAHFAHLTVHGILHLHGHDHETEPQADLMESLETQIITKLGYADPYA